LRSSHYDAMNNALPSLTAEHRGLLLKVASDSIRNGVHENRALAVDAHEYPGELRESWAAFVTLTKADQLRGCVGTLDSGLPLVVNVAKYAYAAAFCDSRFGPLTEGELPALEIHISVLSKLAPIPCQSEAELLTRLQPGIDGLLLEEGGNRGTLLPSVWANIPQPQEFLRQLKRKAGLPPDYWSATVRVKRYVTCCFP